MTQWMVFDSYMEQWEADRRKEEEEFAKAKNKEKKVTQVVKVQYEDPLYSKSMQRCFKIMERMIVQNSESEIFNFYKYYEDKTVDPNFFNDRQLLPLWRFYTKKSRRMNVTAIVMFMAFVAVTLGITYWASLRTRTASGLTGTRISGFFGRMTPVIVSAAAGTRK